jgi:hypothetical protein
MLLSVWIPTCSKGETYLCMESGDTISHSFRPECEAVNTFKKNVFAAYMSGLEAQGTHKVFLCPSPSFFSTNSTVVTYPKSNAQATCVSVEQLEKPT